MSKFGQYQLLERVAVGGMGEVYRARSLGEEGFEKSVAIKRILPAFASDVRFVEMLVTEARIHAPLSHRNIVQIHDLGISEDHEYFIVLEFVDGHDLGALLARLTERRLRGIGPARVPDAVSLYIAIELGEGLHFAHEARDERGDPLGLIHRDISPSNVLLSYAGEVKLSDFGLAKRRTDHSIVGSLKGQLAYMSPEQARRAPLDRRTDIFSLGAVLFEMLTGQSLRTITDDISGWQQVASGAVPNPRQYRSDLLPALDQLLAQALAPDPRDRFPDARAFVAEARGALDLLPRSRAGEAGELTALLRGLLPPGRPRPAKAQSKVIRLLSELAPPAAPAPAPVRARDSGLVLPQQAPAAASPLAAASSPPPAVRVREEPRPPAPRSAAPAEASPPAAKSDDMWPALLDLVAPPITSAPPRGSGLHQVPGLAPAPAPPQPTPPQQVPAAPQRGGGSSPQPVPAPAAAFRSGPPPIPQAARPPPTPPPIPWPPPAYYPGPPPAGPEGLSSVEEIEQLELPDEPMVPMGSMQPMPGGPMQPMAGGLMQPMPGQMQMHVPMHMQPMPGQMQMQVPMHMQPMPGQMQMQVPMHMQPMPGQMQMQVPMQPVHGSMQEMTVPLQELAAMVPMQSLQPVPMADMQPGMSELAPMQMQELQSMESMQGLPAMAPPGEADEDEDEDGDEDEDVTNAARTDWAGQQPSSWPYADTRPERPPSAPYPIEGGYAVAPMQPPARPRRSHLLGIAAGVAILFVAVTHYALLPLEVLAVWRIPARLEVDSTPAGAEVYIDGRRLSARTPTFTEVKRDLESHVVELRLEGFRPEQQELSYSRTVKLAVSAQLIPAVNAGLQPVREPPPVDPVAPAGGPPPEPIPAEPTSPTSHAQIESIPPTPRAEVAPIAPGRRGQIEPIRPGRRAGVETMPGARRPRAPMERVRARPRPRPGRP